MSHILETGSLSVAYCADHRHVISLGGVGEVSGSTSYNQTTNKHMHYLTGSGPTARDHYPGNSTGRSAYILAKTQLCMLIDR